LNTGTVNWTGDTADLRAYTSGWPTTQRTDNGTCVSVCGVHAPEDVLTFHDGMIDYNLHDGLYNGVNRRKSAALQPKLNGQVMYQQYGTYTLRWKATSANDFKIVPLLWEGATYKGNCDGEMDWPEGMLHETNMGGFLHYESATSCGQQQSCGPSPSVPMAGAWHTTQTVWTPSTVTLKLDGSTVCTMTNTSQISDDPHRWVLQAEAWGAYTGQDAHFYVDWMTVDSLD
jgi:hypothetical protein